jgi:hypothetical protein
VNLMGFMRVQGWWLVRVGNFVILVGYAINRFTYLYLFTLPLA